jgi:uncharacterized protein (TIGR02271 family)
MPFKNPKQIFVLMLSDLRQGTEKATRMFQNMAQVAEDPDIKQALEVRIFVSQKVVETVDQCFKLIGEQPVPLSGTRTRIYDVLAEDFRNEVADIQDTKARRFYILAKLNNLAHFRAAEYKTLIAAADVSGNYGVAALLEICLADNLAFVERTKRLIWAIAETRAGHSGEMSVALSTNPTFVPASVSTKVAAQEEVLRLTEEQIDIGKREVETGKARIRRFVTEKPVESQITLHEEHADIERRAVTDPTLAKEVDWADKTIEVTETGEEVVVTKSSRVVEEVIIHKKGSDSVQFIRDRVRRQEVEFERLPNARKTA